MQIELGQQAIDLGIVITDSEQALSFYRDLLGMDHEADTPLPFGGGGTMHRLRIGSTLLKLLKFDSVPDERPPAGFITAGTGYRYFTIHANNIEEVMAACEEAGTTIVFPTSEIRPGTTVAMVEDPDGNIVEFVRYS